MKPRKLMLLSASLLSFAMIAPISAANAVTPDQSNPLYSGIQCEAPRDVSNLFKEAVLDQYLYGYNFNTGQMETLPETASINEYSYVVEDFSGRLVNDGTLKQGDFFTYQLDPAARVGGFKAAQAVTVNDLIVTDENGTKHTLATASFDYTTNKVTYTLTSFIEGKEQVYVENSESFLVKPNVVTTNGVREFTNTFAGTTNTFSYNVDYRGNVPTSRGTNSYSFFSAILEIDPANTSYTQVFYLNPQGVELPNGFTGDYYSLDNATPFGANAQLTAYKLPADYKFSDTFGVDFAALAPYEVTADVVQGSTISVAGPTTDRYVFRLVNNYISNKAPDENGILVETQQTLISGINIAPMADPNTSNHYSYSVIAEQSTTVGGSVIGDDTTNPSVCDLERTVTINKTNSESGTPLAKAVFEVRQNGTAVATLTTDASGKAMSAQIPFGSYELVEVSAPEGFILDKTPIPFTLSRTSPVFNFSIAVENTPIEPPAEPVAPADPPAPTLETPKTPKLAKTGADISGIGAFAGLVIITGVAATMRNKR
ncbi:MAG: SpaA isopeptide-forming pilin-related protein, partial [Arcanobacterium sp.]|nr:SpaA isopeptide-forming pilin-related protein [Arcanobacterium sp.]